MPIYGMTDPETLRKKQEEPKRKKPAVEIAKGYRQEVQRIPKEGGKPGEMETKKNMGKDLYSKLRITVNKPDLGKILQETYKVPDKNGDFIVEAINVFFPSDNLDISCPSQMEAYRKSGFLLACDRRTIFKRCVEEKDSTGVYRKVIEVSEPCPMRDRPLAQGCPNKCEQTAQLQVFIKELFLRERIYLAILDFGGFEDLGGEGILSQMARWQADLGSIVVPPPHPETEVTFRWEIDRGDGTKFACDRIPFVLSRRKVSQLKPVITGSRDNKYRTGNKFDGETWILDIHPDPDWLAKYRSWQQCQDDAVRIQRDGYRLRPQAIARLFYGNPIREQDVIDVTAVEKNSLLLEQAPEASQEGRPEESTFVTGLPRSQRPCTDDMLVQLEGALINNGWTEGAIALLLEDFGIKEPKDMSQEQWVQVCAIATNPQSAKEYNDAALAPPLPEYITQEDWTERIAPVFRDHGWFIVSDGKEDKRQAFAMLQSEFGIARIGELLSTHVPEVLELAKNTEVRDRWIKSAVPT